MMISNCPRCHEPYRIPTDSLPTDAYAKCPWCHETYPLHEALRQLPPVLKIIGADGREITGLGISGRSLGAGAIPAGADAMAHAGNARGLGARRHAAVEDDNLDGAIAFDTTGEFDEPASPMRIEAGNDDELDPEFVIQDARGIQTVTPRRVQPLPPLNSSPKQQKKGSPLKTLLGIALGPVIAIPAAAGILLGLDYMGIKEAPNLGVWPMDGSYSWTSTSNNRTAAAPMPKTDAPSPTPPTGRSLGEELGTADPTSSDPATSALELITSPEETVVPESVSIEALKPDASMPVVSAPEVKAPEVEGPEVTEPVVTAPGVTMPSAEATEPSPPAAEPAVPEPAVATYAPELVAARDKATEMLDQIAALAPTDGKRKPVLVNTYIALASVGSLLDPATTAGGKEIIAKLKADESLLNEIAGATPLWLKLPTAKRPNQGVVIVGDLETSGDSVTIRMANDELLLIEDVDASITNGKVIGLGKIIDGPNGQSVRLTLVESL